MVVYIYIYQVGPWYSQYMNIWAMVYSYISGSTIVYEYTMGQWEYMILSLLWLLYVVISIWLVVSTCTLKNM